MTLINSRIYKIPVISGFRFCGLYNGVRNYRDVFLYSFSYALLSVKMVISGKIPTLPG